MARGSGQNAIVDPLPTTEVCGYRLVRLLEQTEQITTWLGIAAEPAHPQGAVVAPAATTVAVLTCERDVAHTLLPMAVFSLASPYVQRILDVGSDDKNRMVLITERTQESLAELLAARSELRLGEAVTILAPLTAGIRALHDVGLAHGALSTNAVGLTPEGRPLIALVGVDPSGTVPAPAGPELRRGDLSALRVVLDQVFRRCTDGTTEGVTSLLRWVDRSLGDDAGDSFFTQLELRLFALAEPLPIDFSRERAGDDRASATGHTAAELIDGGQARESARQDGRPGALTRLFNGTGLDALAELADSYSLPREITARFAGLSGWVSRALRGRAGVLIVATTVAIGAMWGGLTAIPEAGPAGADIPDPNATEHPAVPVVTPTEAEASAVTSDDPLTALNALLAIRSRCLATGNPGCIPLFDEPDSAAEATDEHALRSKGTVLISAPAAPEQMEVLQRTGNAALFRVSSVADKENQPVLVLVMKTNAGWRVRDLAVPG